jgi:hypothetical protein
MIEPKIYMNGHWMVPYKGGIFYRIHVYGSEMHRKQPCCISEWNKNHTWNIEEKLLKFEKLKDTGDDNDNNGCKVMTTTQGQS